MLNLDTPVEQLQMIGPSYQSRLAKLGILTVRDLVYHLPFRYENYSLVSKIINLQAGETVSITSEVIKFQNIYSKSGKKIQKAQVSDETGSIEAIWYNQPYLQKLIKPGIKIALAGSVKWFTHSLIMDNPEYEIVTAGKKLIHTGRLVPVYPETAGLSSKWLRSRIYPILEKFNVNIPEYLPIGILKKYNLMDLKQAVYAVHFPNNLDVAPLARQRLSFDELLILELAAMYRKESRKKQRAAYVLNIKQYKDELIKFIGNLPFKLTQAQKRVTTEILNDLKSTIPMNRLLEGDVGSGKTVVAAIASYLTYLNGFKALFLAPTEILANQHYQTVKNFLSTTGAKIQLLTGNTSAKIKLDFDVLVGTHAIIYSKQNYEKVALAVIDEQQRFGVAQRAQFKGKSGNPHLLTMTATPIPRTIALTLFADLDLSVIDEMPKNRKIVKTWVVPTIKRNSAYRWISQQIKQSKPHQQVFIVCPFIEESETLLTVKAATVEIEKLKEMFPDFALGLLHGKLKSDKKNSILQQFQQGKINILVSTPVVEVGIDIPNATIMLIEAADRFGLAQIHQLRGRVGRSDLQSYCLLFTESDNPKTIERLKILEKVYSGPKLAEYDLKLRGAGEIFGTAQHGRLGLKIADFSDLTMIKKSKNAAEDLMKQDPELFKFPLLRDMVQKYTIKEVSAD